MVSTSKILTVSYGTFSCTLEGFDDSFDTMKAIAEYFRDLSAGDRYFGSEPATPDAEMLARIAEREISRQVEARDTDGKIHLRAGPAALPAMAALATNTRSQPRASSDTATHASDTTARAGSADLPQTRKTDEVTAATPPQPTHQVYAERATPPRGAQTNSESIADKLRRIRAVAGPSGSAFSNSGYDEDEQVPDFAAEPADAVAAQTPIDSGIGPDDGAEPQVENTEAAAEDVQPDAGFGGSEDNDVQPEIQADEIAEPGLSAAEDETTEKSAMAPIGADAAGESQSGGEAIIAQSAKTKQSADAADASTVSDDDILSRLSADDLAGDISEGADETADDVTMVGTDILDDDETGLFHVLDYVMGDTSDDEDYLTEAGPSFLDDSDDTLAQLLADTLQSGEMSLEEREATDHAEDAQPILSEQTADEMDVEEPQASAAQPRPLAARVVKIKRADLEAALAGGDLEEEMSQTVTDDVLSPEAEAELQRELAEVEAELSQSRTSDSLILDSDDAQMLLTDDTDDLAAQTADVTQPLADSDEDDSEALDKVQTATSEADDEPTETRHERHRDQPAPDAQASRIFDEADTQLGEPESNKRRSAIQHLRAAVAATKAERRAGGAMLPGVDDQPYRKDLQSAVRPRRPQAVTAATPRPGTVPSGRPAPLKLVAEQRIDTPVAPVQPRRITRADLVTTSARPMPTGSKQASAAAPVDQTTGCTEGANDFAGYAERMGANSLTDLLEAAAAYMADVEGTPQFSRPMLMQKLREAHDDDFSREEGLRSFGQLLRQGKLQKLKGGRFAVTDVTDFRQSA